MSPWISDLYLSSQSDERLLSLTRDGHARAFAILVERYRAELLAQARCLGANGYAEDVVQQTLLNAYSALTRGAEVGHLRGWLHAILRNAATRANAPAEAALEELDACGEPLEVVIEHRESARSLISALEDLPSRQRQALLGSSVQGLSRAELASSLGVSEGAVRQLVHRARMAIRTAITSLTPYPLARWLAASGPPAGAGPELALTAGAASAGGLLAKVGVFAAAGAIATGIAAVESHPSVHATAAHHARVSQREGVSAGHHAPVVSAATTAPAGATRDYASARVPGSGATIAAGHHPSRPGAGAEHRISGGSVGPGSGLRVVSGSGAGSGSQEGSRGDSGSGSGRDSAPASGGRSGSGPSGDSGSGPGSSSGATTPQTSGGSDSGGATSTTSGSDGGSGSTDGGGGGGSPSVSTPTVDTAETGGSTTSGQTRDLWPPTGSSPVQDH